RLYSRSPWALFGIYSTGNVQHYTVYKKKDFGTWKFERYIFSLIAGLCLDNSASWRRVLKCYTKPFILGALGHSLEYTVQGMYSIIQFTRKKTLDHGSFNDVTSV
uniref:Uncharacterized protein n=1 Tax=Anopheles dirus TaxID=7168 RepID=A0A182NW34_9DIPT